MPAQIGIRTRSQPRCVYEAFVAYKLDKPIVTARSLHPMAMTQTFRIACIYLASASAGLLLPESLDALDVPSQIAFAVFLILSLGLLGSRGRRLSAIHEATVACTAMFAGLRFAVGISFGTFGIYAVQDFLLNLSLVTALEVDRHNCLQASKQSEELRRGFTTCQNAQCSSSSDADAIWEEIHGSGVIVRELEFAVGALRSMNVSTLELRRTVERTGPLGDASHWNRAIVVSSFTAFWGFSPLLLLAYGQELPEVDDSNYWLVVLLIVLSVLEALAGIALLVTVGPAWRAFAARLQLFWILLLPIYMAGLTTNLFYYLVQIFVISPVVLMLSFLGPARISRAPLLGPSLVRVVFWSSLRRRVLLADKERRNSSGPEPPEPEEKLPVQPSESGRLEI